MDETPTGHQFLSGVEKYCGKTFLVTHRRKGTFVYKVIGISGTFFDGFIVAGETKTMLPENSKSGGERLSLRRSLITKMEEITCQ